MGNPTKYGLIILAVSIVILSVVLTVTFLLGGESGKEAADDSKDLNLILSGIEKVLERANSGILTIYGENSFPILSGKAVGKTLRPVLGAGSYGKGRFLIYTHSSCFVRPYEIKENDKLFANAVVWVSGSKESKNISAAIFAQSTGNEESFQRIFTANKITGENIDVIDKLENLEYLKLHDVIVLNYVKDVSVNITETVRKYVESGGGLIVGATPWSLPEKEIPNGTTFQEEFWGNKILNGIGGIAFAEGHASANTKPGGHFNVSKLFLEDTHAGKVWKNANEIIESRQIIDKEKYRQIYYILNDRSLYAPKDEKFSEQLPTQMERLHELIPSKEEVTAADN